MTQKILYFTAGPQPTVGELADIAALNALAEKPYEVVVRNAAANAEFGEGRPEPGDFLAGSYPATYEFPEGHEDEGDPIYPVFDPDAPPAPPNLPATQAVVSDGQELTIGGETFTFTVEDGVITAIDVA